MGMAGIVMSCAPAVGPVVAGWIIDAFGWRMMFWSILPLAVILLVVSFIFLTNVGELKHPHLDSFFCRFVYTGFWRSTLRLFKRQQYGLGKPACYFTADYRCCCAGMVYPQTVSYQRTLT